MATQRSARQLVVFLHVLSSVAWMSQALALVVLLAAGGPGPWAAQYLDAHVLVYCANVSAFTGYLLAVATQWGCFRHWWVATKFALTTVQLYAGIFVLSAALHAAAGSSDPAPGVAAGAALMVSALAFQTWLSVAKPWGRTSVRAGRDRGVTAPTWVFVAAVLAPVADVTVGVLGGAPLPAVEIALLAAVVVVMRVRRRRSDPPRRGGGRRHGAGAVAVRAA